MPDIKIQRGLPVQPQQTNPDAKLREAAQMYEQHFLNEMVKSMRKTVDHSAMTEPNMAERIYSEQIDSKTVEAWSGRGGVGLADIIYNQLQDRFFSQGGKVPNPKGPIDLPKGSTIKIDETKPRGIPVLNQQSTLPSNEVSFLMEWEQNSASNNRDVQSPYDGDVLQAFRMQDDRQIVKLSHDNGLTSTLSFVGQAKDLKMGDRVAAGQKLGTLSPNALGLTWHVGAAAT
jgi:peptidoglycan hydrolase FlgJ